jgi:hypothetical protein
MYFRNSLTRLEYNKVLLVAIIPFFMFGCLSTNSYVDPQYRNASYDDINPVVNKYHAKIDVEFQRNGKHYPRADQECRSHIERVFRATGVIIPASNGSEIRIKVVVNNIADIDEAVAKGFGTGLTFGAAGSAVTDFYDIKIEFYMGDAAPLTKTYKHAIVTTIGNKPAPLNVEPTTVSDAFGKVVEDAMLNFVKEMQAQNLLSLLFDFIFTPS